MSCLVVTTTPTALAARRPSELFLPHRRAELEDPQLAPLPEVQEATGAQGNAPAQLEAGSAEELEDERHEETSIHFNCVRV